jgi:chromosome segregation ATPase
LLLQESTKELKEESETRSRRAFVISTKLARARVTLKDLQTAQNNYHESAEKVKMVENKLFAKQEGAQKRQAATGASTGRLRYELDQATSMMGVAFKRVEQIEGITDELIRQLVEVETELAEVQAAREEESLAHADEVNRLTKERMELADHLQNVVQRTAEIEAQDEKLKAELAKAAHRAEELETEVAAAKTEAERQMAAERESLAATLSEVRARQAELAADLEAKESELGEALDKASQGTPGGRGAKIVLPMALQRIRETQEALRTEETRKAAAEAKLAELAANGAALEATLKLQLKALDTERQRQLSEKDASLASMTRAVASATKEVAVKQEAVNKLAAEVAALDKERTDLQVEVQEATHRCLELEAQLSQVQIELNQACEEKRQALADAASLRKELDAAAITRDELNAALDANREQCSTLETSIESMKAQLQADGAAAAEKADSLRAAVTAAEAAAANTKLQLAKALAAQTAAINRCGEMEDRIRVQEASVTELTHAVAAAQAKAADLNAQLASTADAAAAQKYEMLRTADDMQTQLGDAVKERDAFQVQLAEQAAITAELESSVAALRVQLSAAETRHAEQVEKLQDVEHNNAAKLDATTSQLAAAAASQDDLVAINAELETMVDSLRENLIAAETTHANKMEELEDAVFATDERLAAALEQLSASAAAQDALGAVNSQLQESVLGLQTRVSMLSEAKLAAEAAIVAATESGIATAEQLRSQLKAAVDAQTMLRNERSHLESQLIKQEASVVQLTTALEALSAASAAKKAEMEEMAARATDRAAVLSSQLQHVCEERDSMDRERMKLCKDLDSLVEALQVKESEVVAAKSQGTPKGEGAKQVLSKAFAKIRSLQQAVLDTEKALSAKTSALAERDVAIAGLEQAARQREELAAALQHQLERATEAAEAQAAELRSELKTEREMNAELEKMNAELAPQVEDLAAQLEAAAGVEAAAEALKATAEAHVAEASAKLRDALVERDALAAEKAVAEKDAANLRAEMAHLNFESSTQLQAAMQSRDAALSEKNAAISEKDAAIYEKESVEVVAGQLRAELAELRYTSATKESANKEVMLKTFTKLRDLKSALDAEVKNVSDIGAKLEIAEANASELAQELATKTAALISAEEDNEALERAMCRLRVDVQVELEARVAAEKEYGAAKEQIIKLEGVVAELNEETAELQKLVDQHSKEVEKTRSESVSEVSAISSKFNQAKFALDAAELRAAAALGELEAARAQAAKKEAASKEVTRRAFEKIKYLQASIQQKDASLNDAADRATQLSTLLSSAQGRLAAAAAEAEQHAKAKESLLADVQDKETALSEMKASKDTATKQVEKLEGDLATEQAKFRELSAAAMQNSSEMTVLQARITELEGLYAEFESAASDFKSEFAQAKEETIALVQEKESLAMELTAATSKSAELEARLNDQCGIVEELKEALSLQKETVTTAKRLGAIREAELSRALAQVENKLAEQQQKNTGELQAAKTQISMLKKTNETLVFASAKVPELEKVNATLEIKASKVEALEKQVAELKKMASQYDALQRANMELCAQISEADSERRAALKASKLATERANKLRSHQVESEAFEIERRERMSLARNGRTWGAIIACALALLWSAAAGRVTVGDVITTSTRD